MDIAIALSQYLFWRLFYGVLPISDLIGRFGPVFYNWSYLGLNIKLPGSRSFLWFHQCSLYFFMCFKIFREKIHEKKCSVSFIMTRWDGRTLWRVLRLSHACTLKNNAEKIRSRSLAQSMNAACIAPSMIKS